MSNENSEKRVPAIRFKGFTNAWEQRKVCELLAERNDQAPKAMNIHSWHSSPTRESPLRAIATTVVHW